MNEHARPEARETAGAEPPAPSTAPAAAAPATGLPDDALLIVAMTDTVLFPGTVFPILVGRPSSVAAAEQALRAERPIGILMQKEAGVAEPGAADLYTVGTIATILRYVTLPDGGHHVVVQGQQRFRVKDFLSEQPVLAVRAEPIDEPEAHGTEIEARVLHLRQQALEALQLLPNVPPPLVAAVQNTAGAGALADLVAAYMELERADRQALLETIDAGERIDKVSALLAKRIEVMRLSQEIGQRTKATFDERQREAILREQMAAIRRELGETDDDGKTQEVAEITQALDAAGLPPEADEIARKELRRYQRMPSEATEAGMLRTYLDWLAGLPWAEPEARPIDIAAARQVLDEDHYGLAKIKQRIIEFLAVRKLAPPDDKQASRIANVIAVVEPGAGTRKVLALAANRPYGLDANKGQTVQRLTTTFAPLGAGSTFKIFTVAAAMNRGLGVNAVVDVPKTYTSPLVPTHPFGNSGSFAPSMPITQALAESPNTPFVALEDQVGLGKVADMAVALGLRGYLLDAGDVDRAFAGTGSTYLQEITAQKMASFTLGVSPVSPLELSNVGATLDSDGTWCPPTPIASIADRNGTQVNWKQQPCEQAVPPELARTLTNAMSGDMHDKDGTAYQSAQQAKWTRVSASKTGTTQDYKSSAFLGYTPYYSAAVITWDYLNHPTSICVKPLRSCSNTEAQSGKGMAGGTVPAQTWLAAMTPLHASEPDTPFPVSDPTYLAGQPTSQVPNVINMSLADAKAQLAAHQFTEVNVSYTNKTAAPANIVVDQNPKQTALPGSTINLVVSSGPSS